MRQDDLSIDERRKRIVEKLNSEGKVRVADLSAEFGISEVTIRNDLDGLEKQGFLERVHGGAVSTYRAYYNMDLYERAKTNEAEKRCIGEAVAKLVCPGDTLLVNSGTTTLYVVQSLRDIKNLTVVTNSVAVAQESDRYRNMEIVLLGGNINAQYQFTYGDDTLNQLKKYRVDKLILSVDGVSAEEGISTGFLSEAEVDRQMIRRANKVIIATDYTKIGRVSFANIDPIDSTDYLVTNANAVKSELELISQRNVEIVTV